MTPLSGQQTTERFGRKLGASTLLILLSVTGLLVIPTHCTCGSALLHGHSLFQLPHHRHDAHPVSDSAADMDMDMDRNVHAANHGDMRCSTLSSAAIERHDVPLVFELGTTLRTDSIDTDGPSLRAPPSSSYGQPMTLLASSLANDVVNHAACTVAQAPLQMRGLALSPDPPPPRASASV